MKLSQVTFGERSSLKQIGPEAFCKSAITDIDIPDKVTDLGERCFSECASLSRVTFGESSSLKRVGSGAFYGCKLTEFRLPDQVGVGSGSESQSLPGDADVFSSECSIN